MKRAVRMALVVFISFILQTSVFTSSRISMIQPDVLAVMLSCLSAHTGTYGGFCAGAASGLLMDTTVGQVLALYVVLYPLMGYISAKIRPALDRVAEKIFKKRFLAWRRLFGNLFICLLLVSMRETVFMTYMFLNGVEVTSMHIWRIVQCLLYSMVLTIPADFIIDRFLNGRKIRVEDEHYDWR